MNKQSTKHVLASVLLLTGAAVGSQAVAAVPMSGTSTAVNNPAMNNGVAVNNSNSIANNNASIESTPRVNPQASNQQQETTGNVYKVKYDSQELLNDPLRNATDITSTRLTGIPTPSVKVSDVSYVTTVIIPQTTDNNTDLLDVSLLDDFIDEISPNARHYPPNFSSNTERYYAKEKLKELEQWLRPFAEAPNASYEVLLRAAKLNGMARNLDLGSDYAVRGSTFIAKAIDRQPDSAEANFIYGMMLSEGGGFKEGKKYLMKAASQSYKEAEQSLAQADLLNDDRSGALTRLRSLQQKHPNDTKLAKQIELVESGKYYIWDLPSQ